MRFIEKTSEFDKWLRRLKDLRAKAKILYRIQRIESDGYFGEIKALGGHVSEMKINYAKGYRVYFTEREGVIVVLLVGGDKSSQPKDIMKAKELAKEIHNKR